MRLLPSITLLLPVLAAAQDVSRPLGRASSRVTRAALDSVTERGTAMAEYDAASWHSSDAVIALRPPNDVVNMTVARRLPDRRWEAVFGVFDRASETFRVSYRAQQRAAGDTAFTVEKLASPVLEGGYFLRAARALSIAREAFGQPTRPYNAMVLPIASGGWYVYFVPAQVRAGYYPLGGDVRFRLDADARSIVERRQMHATILESGPTPPPVSGASLVASYHTAVLADMVEDSDVFHVLVRRPSRPEHVRSASFTFVIDPSGRIVAYEL
jgi:hypothetical protein